MKKVFVVLCIIFCIGSNAFSTGRTETKALDSEDFPKQPITITVPFGAGGAADILARAVASHGNEVFGQPVGVVNRVGAGGVVALTEFMDRAPDGYNLITANIGLFAVTAQTSQVRYTFDDFIPVIGNIGKTNILILTSAKSGIKNYADLKEYGKRNIIKYSVLGIGSDQHILQAALYAEMGIRAEPVNFESVTQPIASILGGNIDVMTALAPVVKDYVEIGDLIPIGNFNADVDVIYEGFGMVPTVKSLGHDITYAGFNFYALPKGTPAYIVDFYTNKIKEIYAKPDIAELQNRLGFIVDPKDPEQIKKEILQGIANVKKWLVYLD